MARSLDAIMQFDQIKKSFWAKLWSFKDIYISLKHRSHLLLLQWRVKKKHSLWALAAGILSKIVNHFNNNGSLSLSGFYNLRKAIPIAWFFFNFNIFDLSLVIINFEIILKKRIILLNIKMIKSCSWCSLLFSE